MKQKISRLSAWILVVVMVFTMLPTVSFAQEPATTTWSSVALGDIKATDTIAITVTNGVTTWALPTVGEGTAGQPMGITAAAADGVLTTEGEAAALSWSISSADGGYYIKTGDSYLYLDSGNNCVRIGETPAVWSIHADSGYLTAKDTSGTARYLGVYVTAPDWRAYTSPTASNIAGQTLTFWVLDPDAVPVEPTDPVAPTEPTEPTEPIEPTEPGTAQLATEIASGDKVYIYNPKNAKVMTGTATSDNKLEATDGVVTDDTLALTDEMAELTVTIDDNGCYTFQNTAGEYLTAAASTNVLTFEAEASEYSLWNVETAEGGVFIKNATAGNGTTPYALEYYGSKFTTYTFQSYNTGAFLLQLYTSGAAGGFTDTIAAGDQVLIYNPTSSVALSNNLLNTNSDGTLIDLEGTELVLSADGKLSGYSEANIWTVGTNADGAYTFTDADGKKLSIVRVNLTLDGDNSVFTLEKLEGKSDEFYVKGPVGSYLQWSAANSYWSAFYAPNEAAYAVRFYLVSGSIAPSNVVAAPKASPASGEVLSGTEISFTCATADATILYKTGESDWTPYAAPIAITQDTVFTVKAVKEGMEDSREVTFSYTIYVPPILGDNQAELVTNLSELSSGDRIVIVTKDYDFAIGVTQKANNRDPANIIKAYDRVSFDEFTQIITLESGVEDGTYALYATNGDNSGYLYADLESGNLLRTQSGKDINASFTISFATDGSADIVSKADKKANTIRYNTVGLFSCYASGQKPVMIYKLIDTVPDPVTDEMVTEGITTLKNAAAGAATVIGQVVYHYGTAAGGLDTVILEDSIENLIYALPVSDAANISRYVVGDVVKVTGTIVDDGGMLQMNATSMEVVKTGLAPIPAIDVTVSELGASYLGKYIHITGVTLGAYNAAGNTTVTDATGSVNLYSGAALPTGLTVADIGGVYGCYTPSALRNGTSADYRTIEAETGMVRDGDVIVIYNLTGKGVLSGMNGELTDIYGCSINLADAVIENGKAVCSNGAVLFTVQKNGDYYRFYNESFGYLCSTGTGNNTYYTMEASENADWMVEAYNGGFKMGSRTASHEGNQQYLQYFSDSFTTWGMYAVTDRDVFTYHFYPCSSDKITDGVVNEPQAIFGNLAPAYAGQRYLLHFTVDALFGVKELKASLGDTELALNFSAGRYTATIPAELIVGESLRVTVTGLDNKGVAIYSVVDIEVRDEPVISGVTPVANSQTKEDKRPVISAVLNNVGENPTIEMTVNGTLVESVYADGKVSYTPAADLEDGRVTVTVTVTRADGKSVSKSWSFTVGESSYTLMFGQLHSHNGEYSDGSGTLSGALDYISSLPESANVDFVAFTDHSNYFDKSGEANPEAALYDLSLATEYSQERWGTYKSTIAEFNNTHSDVIALAGFEMTWSGGPGHMNTFVTDGIVSRNNTTLNNKSADAGMQAYYALLSQDEGVDSITQFNHPGTMFGNFTNFSYWNAQADSRVQLVEVGNGEGQIGSSGYYPSYEQYTLALDKGWHLGPTNNQDNHKGMWGNGNDARDVVLAESFTEEGIYEAIRNYRIYATEDKNLEIFYSVNDLPMGTIIEDVPDTLRFDISVMDPDSSDSISKVELIVNSGKVAYTWSGEEALATGILTAELKPEYSYYYVRVTQADGDLAVTAPIWVGESLKLGVSTMEASTTAPIAGEELTLTTTLFNQEGSDAIVKSIVYTTNGSEVLFTDNTTHLLASGSTLALDWAYTPAVAKLTTITATVIVELENKEYTFSTSVELDVQDASRITYIGIDASHNNEYVSGYNKNLMNNFSTLANGNAIRTELLTTSEALLAACANADGKFSALVLNVPSRRLSEAKVYSEAELTAIAAFNANGGIIILTGTGDTNDKIASAPHMAQTQNTVLQALGSSLRLSDDGTYEGDVFALSFNAYADSPLTAGLDGDTATSYYGGSSIYAVDGSGNASTSLPATVTPVLYANSETISKDSDGDGLGGSATPKYAYAEGDARLLVMATEQLDGKGMIVVAGSAFMNDFDLLIPAENANNRLCENLLKLVNPVKITSIAEIRTQTEHGYKFTIEGVVTSNASGYDMDTAFFDCIYVQDATGGINCFPIAGEFKIGDVVRLSGTTDSYQGETELQIITSELIGSATPVEPTVITSAQLNNRSVEGKLVTLRGIVTQITMANGLVESIYIKDTTGDVARVFIDGYITVSKTIENLEVGSAVEATGIASYDDTYVIANESYARIRVRDRADITAQPHTHTAVELPAVAPTCTEAGLTAGSVCSVCGTILLAQEVIPATGHSYSDGTCIHCGEADPDAVSFPFTDVPVGQWYRGAVEYVFRNDLMNGTSKTEFEPETTVNRAMIVTVLYRLAGEPAVTGTVPFTDTETNRWYSNAVLWGYNNGIVKGTSETEFEPYAPATREQMVTFLYRYAQYMQLDTSAKGDLSAFTDAANVSRFAHDAMTWAVGAGVINGVGKQLLDPSGLSIRAQLAQMIMKFDLLQA